MSRRARKMQRRVQENLERNGVADTLGKYPLEEIAPGLAKGLIDLEFDEGIQDGRWSS